MPSPRRHLPGFTLIELLTVVAIVGVLAAVILPTVGQVQSKARRAADGANLRQIGQAALIYANANEGRFPHYTMLSPGNQFGLPFRFATGETVDGFAAALAVGAGLNDASLWTVRNDFNGAFTKGAPTVFIAKDGGWKEFAPSPSPGQPGFRDLSLAYGVALGLTTADTTVPLAWSRGILSNPNGSWWVPLRVYREPGGFLLITTGNVAYYDDLGASEWAGKLVASNGSKTSILARTVSSRRDTVGFVEETPSGTSITYMRSAGR